MVAHLEYRRDGGRQLLVDLTGRRGRAEGRVELEVQRRGVVRGDRIGGDGAPPPCDGRTTADPRGRRPRRRRAGGSGRARGMGTACLLQFVARLAPRRVQFDHAILERRHSGGDARRVRRRRHRAVAQRLTRGAAESLEVATHGPQRGVRSAQLGRRAAAGVATARAAGRRAAAAAWARRAAARLLLLQLSLLLLLSRAPCRRRRRRAVPAIGRRAACSTTTPPAGRRATPRPGSSRLRRRLGLQLDGELLEVGRALGERRLLPRRRPREHLLHSRDLARARRRRALGPPTRRATRRSRCCSSCSEGASRGPAAPRPRRPPPPPFSSPAASWAARLHAQLLRSPGARSSRSFSAPRTCAACTSATERSFGDVRRPPVRDVVHLAQARLALLELRSSPVMPGVAPPAGSISRRRVRMRSAILQGTRAILERAERPRAWRD